MNDFKIIPWEELNGGNTFFPKGSAVTIGGFDGPHRGHRELFARVVKRAEEDGLTPGLITFLKPPAALKNSLYSGDVSTLRLRLKRFGELGFHFIILIDFSASFARIDGTAFFDILIKTICLKYLAVGSDFSCGYRRGLGVESLKKLAPQMGFCFDSIGFVKTKDSLRISSTAIREAIGIGNLALAKDLLGYPFLFDIAGPPWSLSAENCVSVQRSFLTQILPPCGRYKGFLVSFSGVKKEAVFLVNENDVQINLNGNSASFDIENLNNFDAVELICKE